MRTTQHGHAALRALPAAVAALLLLAALLAAPALAADMPGMPGMSAADMPGAGQSAAPAAGQMPAPLMAHDAQAASASGEHMDMGGSANWFVISGFVAVIAACTIAAAAMKASLRRRTLAGEFAGSGVQNV